MPQLSGDAEPVLEGDDKQLSQDFAEALGFIKSSIGKMDRLISAILNLTREGRREFEPVPIDTRELIEDIVTTLAHQAAEAEARFAIEHAAGDRQRPPGAGTDLLQPDRQCAQISQAGRSRRHHGQAAAPSSALRSSRSPTTAAASIRRTTSGFSTCSAAPEPRTSRARASGLPMSARWCAGSVEPCRCNSELNNGSDLHDNAAHELDSQQPESETHEQTSHHHHDRGRRGPRPPDRAEYPPLRRQQRDHAVHQRYRRASTTSSASDGDRPRPQGPGAADPARSQPARHDRHRDPAAGQGEQVSQMRARGGADHDRRRPGDQALLRARLQRLHHQARELRELRQRHSPARPVLLRHSGPAGQPT